MAYKIPEFNLNVAIFTGPWPVGIHREIVKGNLAFGRRVQQVRVTEVQPANTYGGQCTLLLPALTDIRDGSCNLNPDFVEVPSGSGRWYGVMLVDDVGKGFANEYRAATIGKIWQGIDGVGSYPGLFWPTPIS